MPLHISEIGVRMAVNEDAGPEPEDGVPAPPPGPACSRIHQIVSACVQRVLAALRLARQR